MLNPPWKEDDELLIQEFRNGNIEAFNHIYQLHNSDVWFFARDLIKDSAEAEDIVSHAFIKVWGRREKFETAEQIRPFLFAVVRNDCIDFIKKTIRKKVSYEQLPSLAQEEESRIEASIIESEMIRQVIEARDVLPPGMKKVFELLFIEGLTMDEAATTLKVSVETVRSQKTKALQILRTMFQDKEFLVALPLFCTLLTILNLLLQS